MLQNIVRIPTRDLSVSKESKDAESECEECKKTESAVSERSDEEGETGQMLTSEFKQELELREQLREV